jgi:hypothetical protein
MDRYISILLFMGRTKATRTKESNMDAKTLMNQIGTSNLMAVGARDFSFDGDKLMFRVGSASKLSKVVITLEADDTYSVRVCVMKLRTYEVVLNEVVDEVYADRVGAVVREMGDF